MKQFVASAFIFTNKPPFKILLVFHPRFYKWMAPGGHIKEDENPYEAVLREVYEETGIKIQSSFNKPQTIELGVLSLPIPNYLFEEHILLPDQPPHHHIDHIYMVKIAYQKVSLVNREKNKLQWFAQKEIKNLDLIENVRYLINKTFSELTS